MAYTLTLTREERKAFDWIGNRYTHGDDMSSLLRDCLKEDERWGDDGDITFSIPEHIAWQIRDLAEQEDFLWPCFAPELREKMQSFVDNIV